MPSTPLPAWTIPTATAVPATVVKQGGDATALVVESGLFGSGAVLTPAAGSILDDLFTKLRRGSDELVITVTGHTDDIAFPAGGRFIDDLCLGIARTITAAERLEAANLRADAVVLRNCTVVIRVSRRSAPGTGAR